MDKQPIVIEKYVSLLTEKELDKKDQQLWFGIVRDYGPEGILNSVQIYAADGRKNLGHLTKKVDEGYIYVIPLKRDLTEKEAQEIVKAWESYYQDDFEIEHSHPEYDLDDEEGTLQDEEGEVDEEIRDYDWFAEELTKLRHQSWLRNLQNAGWRYGTQYSAKEKTNPMMLPWEQLPDNYKDIDYDFAAEVFDILENLGYEVIEK